MRWYLIVVVLGVAAVGLLIGIAVRPEKPETGEAPDYVAMYNEAVRPVGYDPAKDAAPDYEQAAACWTRQPPGMMNHFTDWPGDIPSETLGPIKEWLDANREAIEHLRNAAKKPYYYQVLKTCEGEVSSFDLENTKPTWEWSLGLALNAKLLAFEGQVSEGLEDVLTMYRLGLQNQGPVLGSIQFAAETMFSVAANTAISIFSNTQISADELGTFQKSFADLSRQRLGIDFVNGDRFYEQDMIDRLFTDDGSGNGKMIPEMLQAWMGRGMLPEMSPAEAKEIATGHPDKRETIEQMREFNELVASLARRTPWQLHQEGIDVRKSLEAKAKGSYLLERGSGVTAMTCEMEHHSSVMDDALITVIAGLRFQAEQGHPAESLDELRSAGYLEEIPMDPYSDGPLQYRVRDKGFVLYSVGRDFEDDGGKADRWGLAFVSGDDDDAVLWPMEVSGTVSE